MIVCQCNVLCCSDIRNAAEAILRDDPYAVVTPGTVFRCCGVRPQCGGCMPSVAGQIVAVVDSTAKVDCVYNDSRLASYSTEPPQGSVGDEGQQKGHRLSEQG